MNRLDGTTGGKRVFFFELPYWESLLIHHNLDVMHIEKNICESLLGTLLGLAGKCKDNEKARLDLQELGIRKDQHPLLEKGKYTLPSALYKLGGDVLMLMVTRLLDLKVMTIMLYYKIFYPWWYATYCLKM
jgi:hypothetical protein